MGDRRYEAAYRLVAEAPDRSAAIRGLDDEAVVHALAAASRKMDAYLANVLAVEVLNRHRRQRAALWGTIVGLAVAIVARSAVLFALGEDRRVAILSMAALLPAALAGYAAYRWMLAARPG